MKEQITQEVKDVGAENYKHRIKKLDMTQTNGKTPHVHGQEC